MNETVSAHNGAYGPPKKNFCSSAAKMREHYRWPEKISKCQCWDTVYTKYVWLGPEAKGRSKRTLSRMKSGYQTSMLSITCILKSETATLPSKKINSALQRKLTLVLW
jgi:hypothetical protein